LFAYLFLANATLWSCKVPGCNGKGNKISSKNSHVFDTDCPYEFRSWKNLIGGLTDLPDRLNPIDVQKYPIAR